MAVGPDDIARLADLARVTLVGGDVRELARDLDGILSHMEALATVPLATTDDRAVTAAGMLRPDAPRDAAAADWSAIAPAMHDGFFLVPRLHTHGDAAADA